MRVVAAGELAGPEGSDMDAGTAWAGLLAAAAAAAGHAYAPYSRFGVGAALLTPEGRVFTGCNVENASYGLTICAERVALAKAVSEGERRFRAIAVAVAGSNPGSGPCFPCGACRQVLAEFDRALPVILSGPDGEPVVYTLDRLLPLPFPAAPSSLTAPAPADPGGRQ